MIAAVAKAVRPRAVRNWLSGTPLGHPAHPMLTDVPIGAWTMSALLDVFGGRDAEAGADLLVKAGVLAAVPTAASGLNDWSDTMGAETRIGLVQDGANSSAFLL
ncbi:MAG: iron-sulfur protein, partial [Solirubrobacteraceae bacterium]